MSRLKTLAGYLVMLGCTGIAFYFIRARGMTLTAPEPSGDAPLFGATQKAAHVDTLLHVLIALLVVIVLARGIGKLFALFHQPPVIGEIVAGIMLGPSLLGRVAPEAAQFILPAQVAPFLQILAQVGVILFMFLVGVELDPALMRKRGHATVAISHASILAPFLLGSLLGLAIYPTLSTRDVPFTAFALFMGVSMSVTAFPVLARILTDRKMQRSRMGVIALTCAAVDDVTAWCLLALVVSVVQSRGGSGVYTGVLAIAYIAGAIFLIRPLMVRLARYAGNRGQLTQGVMALVFLALLLSSLATDLIGIHAVFGAFVLGAVIPHDSLLGKELINRLEDLVVVLFLPAFFAFTGMRTQIGLVSGWQNWAMCGVIILIASLGKFGGSAIAARLTGLGWRDSAALGILMNTRGLMELIVLNIGLELRVISPTLFAMLVIMAVVTTFMTTPILHLLTRGQASEETAKPAPPRLRKAEGVLVPISNPEGTRTLIELASAATRHDDPRPRMLALVRRPLGGVRTNLMQVEEAAPQSPVLTQAMDYARERGAEIDAQALWTEDPAADILAAARDPNIRWVLLGFHRPVFGADALGGVIRSVFERASEAQIDAAVVIHAHDHALETMAAIVDSSPDGVATLDLACRIAGEGKRPLRVIMVPRLGSEPEPALQDMLRRAGRDSGRWLHTDVLGRDHKTHLTQKTSADLVLIGSSLADELGLPLEDIPHPERCVVVVRGGSVRESQPDIQPKAAAS
jgi:Kef-type K+ transport system membrane component KefB